MLWHNYYEMDVGIRRCIYKSGNVILHTRIQVPEKESHVIHTTDHLMNSSSRNAKTLTIVMYTSIKRTELSIKRTF